MTHTDQQLDAFASWERQSWETRAAAYAGSITVLTRGAADALLLDAAVLERRATVAAVQAEHAGVALAIAEEDKILAEQPRGYRHAARLPPP